MANYIKNPCERCGHGPDWHSFKDGVNGGSTDVTSKDAWFSCNGENFTGCDVACPDFVGQVLTWIRSPW